MLRGCDVPETSGRTTPFPISPCIGLGLHCPLSYLRDGRLLPHLFTLTRRGERFAFCCTCRELALTQVPLAFTRNPVLWCPDFPLHNEFIIQRMTTSRKFHFNSKIISRHKQSCRIDRIEWAFARLRQKIPHHLKPLSDTLSIFDQKGGQGMVALWLLS